MRVTCARMCMQGEAHVSRESCQEGGSLYAKVWCTC